MFDRFFAPLLAFTVHVAATLAFAFEMAGEGRGQPVQQARAEVIMLPAVTVTGKRAQSVALAQPVVASALQ